MSKHKQGVLGLWLDEHKMVDAAKKATDGGHDKLEAYSPFPLHGIDEAMNIPRSWIPFVTAIMGTLGCAAGVVFTYWVSVVDWPMMIAGKPHFSLPAFIPIIFELTILFAALSSVGAMLSQVVKKDPKILDPDITCHKFALFIPENDSKYNEAEIEKMFKEMGADEVRLAEA